MAPTSSSPFSVRVRAATHVAFTFADIPEIVFVEGIAGQVFRDQALTVVFSLAEGQVSGPVELRATAGAVGIDGALVGTSHTVIREDVPVANGTFTLSLDFGPAAFGLRDFQEDDRGRGRKSHAQARTRRRHRRRGSGVVCGRNTCREFRV